MNKDHPPNKKAGYILMAADGEAGTKAVPVSEFIKEYLLTDEIANYILDKYNLNSSGVKEVKFKALEQFINKQYRKFFDISFNGVNLPMVWCVSKHYTIDKIIPFVLIMSPYYDAVVGYNEATDTYLNPKSIIFDGNPWYYNVFQFLNVGDVAKAKIPYIAMKDEIGWTDIARKLYSIAEVKYD